MKQRPAELDHIYIQGAREHNLKGVSVDLPRDELIVFTGLSGSGKSSLAFDTIYADEPTPLIREAASRGARVTSGSLMFILQAERQFKAFTGKEPPTGLFASLLDTSD